MTDPHSKRPSVICRICQKSIPWNERIAKQLAALPDPAPLEFVTTCDDCFGRAWDYARKIT